jgi:hypothetical protein
MGNTLAQNNMEVCWMHEGQCQMHQLFQVMSVQYSSPLLLNESKQLNLERQSQRRNSKT